MRTREMRKLLHEFYVCLEEGADSILGHFRFQSYHCHNQKVV